MRKIEIKLLFCLTFFLCFNFFLLPANGANVVDQQADFIGGSLNGGSDSPLGQVFKPAQNNISGLAFSKQAGTATEFDIYICKGAVDYNHPENYLCNGSGNSLVKLLENVAVENTGDGYHTEYFTPIEVEPDELYYFTIVHTGTYQRWHTTSAYARGNCFFPDSDCGGIGAISMKFQTYYDNVWTPPPPTPTFRIELLTPATTTPFTTFYGQPASFTFNYLNPLDWYPLLRFMVKRQADPRASAWREYVGAGVFRPDSGAASTTLTYATTPFHIPDGVYDLDVYFDGNIPASPVHATTTFTVHAGGEYGGYSFSTTTLLTPPTFSTAELCGDIATTTVFGAIECGMIKALVGAITWAFAPSFDTLTNFKVSFELFKGCFPFNTYFQLTDTITEVASSTATSTAGTIKIPFIQTITAGGDFYMKDVISSSTLSNWIGVSNYNLFRTTIGYFFWLIACAVVFFTIKFI